MLSQLKDRDGVDGMMLEHTGAPWQRPSPACGRQDARRCPGANPCRDGHGITFEYSDSYRVVLRNAACMR